MRSALSLALAALVVVSLVPSTAAAAGTATDRSPTAGAAQTAAPGTAGATTDVPAGRTTNKTMTDNGASNHDACARFAEDPKPNPEGDPLGYENGCWANETLSVTTTDGLNETELDAIIGRSMARVETIRDLEFQRTVPVELVSLSEYRAEFRKLTTEPTTEQRLHQDVKWEALFIVNESTDALDRLRGNFVNGTNGFYDPRRDEIRIITPDPESATVDELTLGHELVHALQDQRFNRSYNRSTTDGNHAADGIIEGDASYVEGRYDMRCGTEWECTIPSSGGGGSGDINVGLQVNNLVPYSEGSAFVRSLHQTEGWEAVNAVYERPPETSEQVIHPEAYPDEESADVRIDHSPSGDWRVLELEDSIDYATFGEGAIYTMFWYASYERSVARGAPSTVGIPYLNLFNYDPQEEELPPIAPYNYSHPVTSGWNGDRLVPYVTDESAETGETGYVWKIAWDSERDADEFVEAYRELITYRGAEPVGDRVDTFRIPDDSEFDDAFWIQRQGDTVLIVNAPSVEALSEVRQGAAPEVTPTPTATEAPTETATATAVPETDTTTATNAPTATGTATPTPTDATAESGPGFGGLALVVAVVLVLAAARRRSDR